MLILCLFTFRKAYIFFLFSETAASLRHVKGVAKRLHKTDIFLKIAGYLHFLSVTAPLQFLSFFEMI